MKKIIEIEITTAPVIALGIGINQGLVIVLPFIALEFKWKG
jgi:hypothetical protein